MLSGNLLYRTAVELLAGNEIFTAGKIQLYDTFFHRFSASQVEQKMENVQDTNIHSRAGETVEELNIAGLRKMAALIAEALNM
jgi:reverse gyrase